MKIFASTAIRSEYDILFPVINRFRRKKHNVQLIISGAHLSDWHSSTLSLIEKDGFKIADKIDSLFSTNNDTQRIKGIGVLVNGISQCVDRERPDLLLYVGDREEGIATALVSNYMNIPFAHLSGGDPVWGNADDPVRHAISKLAHIHFTFTEEYAKNLQKLGEEDFRVFHSGNPSLDNIKNTKQIKLEELSNTLNFRLSRKKYIVLIKHPLSSQKKQAGKQMKVVLDCLSQFCKINKFKVVGIYPNTDPGSYDILNSINRYENDTNFKFFKNLPHLEFVNLMRNAVALIGNSSMGLLEAPFYKLPAVNVGERQTDRLNAGNVHYVNYNQNDILKALDRACLNRKYQEKINSLDNPYGDGNSSKKICDIIESIDLNDKKWLTKKSIF
tara:strand:+ start:7748 stop:8908 length:1161 start_codon:yes stop_codon:yes gene_type:complete